MPNRRLTALLASGALLLVGSIGLMGRSTPSADQTSTGSRPIAPAGSGTGAPDPVHASEAPLGGSRGDSAVCPEAASERESVDIPWLSALQPAIVQRLVDSSDAEHLLVASYVARFHDSAYGWQLLSRALEVSSGNTLVVRSTLGFCLKYPDSQGCEGAAIDDRALAADGQNGTLWLALAARRAERGDPLGALEALERAATAPLFDSYFSQQVLAADRALAAASNLRPSERLEVAFGIVPFPLEEQGFELCRKQLESSDEWRHMCLRVATRMEGEGDTLVIRVLGAALQARIHRFNGDAQQADAAEERRAALRDTLAETAEVLDEQILHRKPQLINQYLASLTSYGETGASEFIKKEYDAALADRCHHPDRTDVRE